MEKFRKYLTRKEYILFVISLMIVGLSTFSYALFYSIDNRDEDIVTTECFKLSFEGVNDINLDKAYPMSESEGNQLTPYTFTIKNVCRKAGDYELNIETKEESSLSTNYLRYKLNTSSSDILGNQLEITNYLNENIKESRNIDAGIIMPNEEKTYNLRLWIDEASTVSQSANKLYKGKVVIKNIEIKEPFLTIALNLNNGNLDVNQVVKVKSRKMGSLPNPTKAGYTFEGWYEDSELTNKVNENTLVTEQMTDLYANYTPNTNTPYTVEHYQMDTDGNYPSEPFDVDNLEGTTDTQVTPTTRTYEGFTSPNAEEINIDGDGNKVLKYYYTRNRYTVTYSSKGIVTPESEELYYGELANIPTPIRYGYTFDGWFDAASGGNEYSTLYVVTGPTTMYGQWTEKTYTLTINPNGGSIGGTTSTTTRTLKYSDVYDIVYPTKQWYKLGGFNELPDPVSETGLTGIEVYKWTGDGSVASKSKSSDNPISTTTSEYQVVNPGTSEASPGLGGFRQIRTSAANKVFVHVFVAKLPAGLYFQIAHNSIGDGYSDEWLTSNEGTGKWQTYIYRINCGSTGTFSTFGHVYVNNSPIRNSAALTGSYTMYLASSNIYDITNNQNGIGQIDGSATLTAKWVDQTYTLTINPNGGTWGGTTSSTTKTVGYSEVLNIPNPTRSGKTFNGWSQLSTAYYSDGLASVKAYNNAGNGVVTVTTQSKSSDNPLTGMSNQVKITNSGSAATRPAYGGFYHTQASAANKTYVHVFVAKIPTGFYAQIASNSLGTGGSYAWLTNNAGTGKWQTYVYKVTTGSSGTFSSFGYVFLNKTPERTSGEVTGSVTWYLAFSNLYDITSNKNGIGQWDGTAVLTATWK